MTETAKSTTYKKTLLDNIEQIITLANEHKMQDAFFKHAKPSLEAVASILRITETQAALFSLILEHSDDGAVSIGNIGKVINCGRIQILKYMDDFEALEKKCLIRTERGDFLSRSQSSSGLPSYYVPIDVIKAVRAGCPYRNKSYSGISAEDFFDIAKDLLTSCRDKEISEISLSAELNTLFSANANSAFVQNIKTFRFGKKTGIQLLAFCCAWLEEDVENIPMSCLRPLLGYGEVRQMDRRFKIGDHQLIEESFIASGNDLGIADTETWTITQKTRETFLADVDLKQKKQLYRKNNIPSSSIQECKMFYSPRIAARIEDLGNLLKEENFSSIKQRLSDRKMATAFTILFQGYPGTGKTETAYQIARITGRDIFLVDISETKSQWFGESEKRIKAVFDRYKSMIKSAGLTPILLFNEADAVLGKRQELGETRRGPAQTENAIQNIILQEMENLHGGILIATTNMAANFDKAFERRFLYKIEFEKPDKEARAAIWRNRLPELADDDASDISLRYNFSGGQIENIARKQTITHILNGTSLTLDGIAALCENELLDKATKRIGFATA